jgi:hypothetical protein
LKNQKPFSISASRSKNLFKETGMASILVSINNKQTHKNKKPHKILKNKNYELVMGGKPKCLAIGTQIDARGFPFTVKH